MSLKVKLIWMYFFGLILLLGVIGFGADAVRNGFSISGVLIFAGTLVAISWWVKDFRNIREKVKASKEDQSNSTDNHNDIV